MPRKPKPAQELTADEAMRRVFGRTGAAHAKRLARSSRKTPKPQVKSTKEDFTG